MLLVMVLACSCRDDTFGRIEAVAVGSVPTVHGADQAQGLTPNLQREVAPGTLPTIVATTRLWADLVSGIVCEGQVHVKVLMPMGSDPHSYQLSLADRAALQDASLVVMNGLMEEGFATTIRSVEEAGGNVFRVMDYLDSGLNTSNHVHTGNRGISKQGDHRNMRGDPHMWMDPVHVSEVLPILASRIIQVVGLQSSTLEACLKQAQARLAQVDAEIKEMVTGVHRDNRILVTDHDFLSHFADRYGFEVLGSVIAGNSTLAASNPVHMKELGQRMKASGVSVIFVEAGRSSKDAEALAKHLGGGMKVVKLFTDGLPRDDARPFSYTELLRTNVHLITDALSSEASKLRRVDSG